MTFRIERLPTQDDPETFTIADIRRIERTYEDKIAALKAEVDSLSRGRDARAVTIRRLMANPSSSGHSCSDRAIVNDRLDALEAALKARKADDDALIFAVKELQYRETRLDSRLDDFLARIDEIERAHLESTR